MKFETTPPQPVYGLFSGTIRLGATPSGLTSAHLHHSPIFFMGRMPFLLPNQQHQSTEANEMYEI